MAKTTLPNPLDRRHLVERDIAPAQALKLAEAYLEQGRALEAVDFLRKANAAERLAVVRAQALESGDVFLLRAVAAATKTPPDREEWRTLAEAAATAGKERYAVDARRQAEREEE